MRLKLRTIVFLKFGVHPGLYGIKTEDVPGKAMHGAYLSHLKVIGRLMRPRFDLVPAESVSVPEVLQYRVFIVRRPLEDRGGDESLQPLLQAYLHFIGRLIGKGESNDVRNPQRVRLTHQEVENTF